MGEKLLKDKKAIYDERRRPGEKLMTIRGGGRQNKTFSCKSGLNAPKGRLKKRKRGVVDRPWGIKNEFRHGKRNGSRERTVEKRGGNEGGGKPRKEQKACSEIKEG